jgi:hypothetical protein
MIDFNRFNLCFQLVKAFFKRTIQSNLFEAVFDEIYTMPAKAYDENNPGGNQQYGRRKRRKSSNKSIQNIPSGHISPIFNIIPSMYFDQCCQTRQASLHHTYGTHQWVSHTAMAESLSLIYADRESKRLLPSIRYGEQVWSFADRIHPSAERLLK